MLMLMLMLMLLLMLMLMLMQNIILFRLVICSPIQHFSIQWTPFRLLKTFREWASASRRASARCASATILLTGARGTD